MYLKPSDIFYSQNQISRTFGKWNRHRNTTIGETLDDLCEGRCKISDIKTIEVTRKDNKWHALDNRRLWVFHHLEGAGKCTKIPVEEVSYSPSSHSRKFSSINGGTSVKIIKGNPGGKWHSRIKPVKPQVQTECTQIKPKCKDIRYNGTGEDRKLTDDCKDIISEEIKSVKTTVSQVTKIGLLTLTNTNSITATTGSSALITTDVVTKTSNNTALFSKDAQPTSSRFSDFTVNAKKAFNLSDSDCSLKIRRTWCSPTIRAKPYQYKFSDRYTNRYNNFLHSHMGFSVYCRLPLAQTERVYFQKLRTRYLDKKSDTSLENEADSVTFDSSDNDLHEDDIDMLVDDREDTDNEERHNIDSFEESKEIDYDDDPWSDDSSADSRLEPNYDELDVWESESDKHLKYTPCPDSESSDFEDDFLLAKEMENKKKIFKLHCCNERWEKIKDLPKKVNTYLPVIQRSSAAPLPVQTSKDRTSVATDTVCHTHIPKEFQTSVTPSLSSNITTTTNCTSNNFNEMYLKVCGSDFDHTSSRTNGRMSTTLLDSQSNSTTVSNTVRSPFSAGCATLTQSEISTYRITTIGGTFSTDTLEQYTYRGTATSTTSRSCTTSVKTVYSQPIVSAVPTATFAVPAGPEESVSSASVDSDISSYSDSESDWDGDDEEDEDSEDMYFSFHYTFDDARDKKRHARDISIRKYGYDLLDSDSD